MTKKKQDEKFMTKTFEDGSIIKSVVIDTENVIDLMLNGHLTEGEAALLLSKKEDKTNVMLGALIKALQVEAEKNGNQAE